MLGGMGLPKDLVVATPDDLARYRDVPGTVFRAATRDGRVLYARAP
jgi:hypothetical protein